MTAMSEKALLGGLIDAAQRGGFLVHHSRPARTARGWATAIQGDAGLPDLIAVNAERAEIVVIECKSQRGQLDPMQAQWLDAFTAAGIDARVVRPADYDATWRWLVGDRLMEEER